MNASRRSDVRLVEEPIDSLRAERDALLTRVKILEASLACIERESDVPRIRPELSFMAVQRIGSVARQALDRDAAPASGLRPIARAR
ncbi:MAG TPA: hypothetical protein VLT33_23450 [Labilithrix sp.]|nr:hypothetical protein [Labilithrix sp.]